MPFPRPHPRKASLRHLSFHGSCQGPGRQVPPQKRAPEWEGAGAGGWRPGDRLPSQTDPQPWPRGPAQLQSFPCPSLSSHPWVLPGWVLLEPRHQRNEAGCSFVVKRSPGGPPAPRSNQHLLPISQTGKLSLARGGKGPPRLARRASPESEDLSPGSPPPGLQIEAFSSEFQEWAGGHSPS